MNFRLRGVRIKRGLTVELVLACLLAPFQPARTAGSFTEQRFVVEFNLPVAGSDSGNWREMERGGERALFPPLLTVFFTSSSSLSKRLQNRKSSTKCPFPELAG